MRAGIWIYVSVKALKALELKVWTQLPNSRLEVRPWDMLSMSLMLSVVSFTSVGIWSWRQPRFWLWSSKTLYRFPVACTYCLEGKFLLLLFISGNSNARTKPLLTCVDTWHLGISLNRENKFNYQLKTPFCPSFSSQGGRLGQGQKTVHLHLFQGGRLWPLYTIESNHLLQNPPFPDWLALMNLKVWVISPKK